MFNNLGRFRLISEAPGDDIEFNVDETFNTPTTPEAEPEEDVVEEDMDEEIPDEEIPEEEDIPQDEDDEPVEEGDVDEDVTDEEVQDDVEEDPYAVDQESLGLSNDDKVQSMYIKSKFKDMVDLYRSVVEELDSMDLDSDKREVVNKLVKEYELNISRAYNYLMNKYDNADIVEKLEVFLEFRGIFIALNEKKAIMHELLEKHEDS
jgi:hypothetical protein